MRIDIESANNCFNWYDHDIRYRTWRVYACRPRIKVNNVSSYKRRPCACARTQFGSFRRFAFFFFEGTWVLLPRGCWAPGVLSMRGGYLLLNAVLVTVVSELVIASAGEEGVSHLSVIDQVRFSSTSRW